MMKRMAEESVTEQKRTVGSKESSLSATHSLKKRRERESAGKKGEKKREEERKNVRVCVRARARARATRLTKVNYVVYALDYSCNQHSHTRVCPRSLCIYTDT